MAFHLDELFSFCSMEIRRFASAHRDEMFYAFAIDAGLLCLNSEQAFAKTLSSYREQWSWRHRAIAHWNELTEEDLRSEDYNLGLWERHEGLNRSDRNACLRVINDRRSESRAAGNPFSKVEGIAELRANTGDWAYQGFADMSQCRGFDQSAYAKHYDMPDEAQKTSAYGTAMDALLRRLRESGTFAELKTTPDFSAERVEHTY